MFDVGLHGIFVVFMLDDICYTGIFEIIINVHYILVVYRFKVKRV